MTGFDGSVRLLPVLTALSGRRGAVPVPPRTTAAALVLAGW